MSSGRQTTSKSSPRKTPRPAVRNASAKGAAKPISVPSERRKAQEANPTAASKRLTAQQRLAAERRAAAEARSRAERRTKILAAVVPVVAVIAIVIAFVVVKAFVHSGPKSGAKAQAAAAAVITDVTTVPAATANAIGAGTIKSAPKSIKATVAGVDGKPRVLYVGADYCPFCAAERWSMVVALSRFGTWKNLGQTESAGKPEAYPKTQTLSFHGATLTSTSIAFTGYEQYSNQVKNNQYVTLDSISAADNTLLQKFDAPPYVSKDSKGSIPFVLIGGKYVISGASYDPAVLQGKTHAQIAAALKDPGSAIAKAVIGTANVITAAVCAVLTTKPAVCTTAGVTAGATKLAGGQ